MKFKKLFLETLTLVACLSIALSANADANSYPDFEVDGIYYYVWSTSKVYVWYEDPNSWDPCYSGQVYRIPSTVVNPNDGKTYTVAGIGPWVFYNCTNVQRVYLPSSITVIDNYAFDGCSSLSYLSCEATTPPTVSSNTFEASTLSRASLYVPISAVDTYKSAPVWQDFSSINSMLPYDFYADGFYFLITGANTVKLTNSYGSPYTGSISIPSTVSYSGTTYTVTAIGENAFYETQITSVIIPNTVKEIQSQAFYKCQNLSDVDLGNGITTIGIAAFANCIKLSTIDFPNSLITIHMAAFSSTDLTQVIIPNSVQTIGEAAFSNCPSLTDVTIGSSVKEIGGSAFVMNSKLLTVTCLATTPPSIDQSSFDNQMYSYGTLYVPSSALNDYRNADIWRYFYQIEGLAMTVRGDVNGDGSVNISDVTALINYLLSGNAVGVNLGGADVNQDGNVNISDVTALINYLLSGTW